MTRTEPIPSMADSAEPLFLIAYMIGHEDEVAREIGLTLLVSAAYAYVEYISYIKHVQSCPQCILRRKLVELLLGNKESV